MPIPAVQLRAELHTLLAPALLAPHHVVLALNLALTVPGLPEPAQIEPFQHQAAAAIGW